MSAASNGGILLLSRSRGRHKMTKRKKLRTSGGEGICSPKFPKNPRLGDSGGCPQSSEWGSSCLPEESEGRSGPVPSAEQRTEEPGQAASSPTAEEAQVPSSLLGQPEKEPAPLPLSQNSARRFVPQFAKPRMTVTRSAEMRGEDLRSGTPKVSQETSPGSRSQQARGQLREESLGLASWEARELGAQTQVDSTHLEHRDQSPTTPVPGSGDSQPSASTSASPEWGTVPSQNRLSEQGTNTADGATAAESVSQRPEQDPVWFNLSLGAFAPPVLREPVGDPSQETRACHDRPDAPEDPTGWPEPPPGPADLAASGGSPAGDPDFLLDSQIRDALEAPDFAASPEQTLQEGQETALRPSHGGQSHQPAQMSPSESTGPVADTRSCPPGSRRDSGWPGTSPQADGGPLTEVQLRTAPGPAKAPPEQTSAELPRDGRPVSSLPAPRTCVGIKRCEAARMEDATDTVQGLVVELSNLNRLIMSAHRDLGAFRRLSYRTARPAGKAPAAPYTPKGAANPPPAERSWRDL
ncbi:uncharacterized protein C19orf57 homolog isoform X5 [Suricata suricatta]|uniref:uncharacterized protein C19orf57 homolog isoform X5 n=1 Tax=Suricata suricatta TaxID=37032 RepID=UPI001156087B|nr:uncharacterized protein C19orf57 homolog isoform X5 [Suricata suricatta]